MEGDAAHLASHSNDPDLLADSRQEVEGGQDPVGKLARQVAVLFKGLDQLEGAGGARNGCSGQDVDVEPGHQDPGKVNVMGGTEEGDGDEEGRGRH